MRDETLVLGSNAADPAAAVGPPPVHGMPVPAHPLGGSNRFGMGYPGGGGGGGGGGGQFEDSDAGFVHGGGAGGGGGGGGGGDREGFGDRGGGGMGRGGQDAQRSLLAQVGSFRQRKCLDCPAQAHRL